MKLKVNLVARDFSTSTSIYDIKGKSKISTYLMNAIINRKVANIKEYNLYKNYFKRGFVTIQ